MSDEKFLQEGLIGNAAHLRSERRRFLRQAGMAGVAGAGLLGMNHLTGTSNAVMAQTAITDNDILNFALNLEYLEAEYYLRAAFGRGLADADTTGTGTRGNVTGGRQVAFATDAIRQYAFEIAIDEEIHVKFLRSQLGAATVARPAINIQEIFAVLAQLAGLGNGFDPYADENSFLLGAFIFEDVGVTAYKGAAPLLTSKTILEAAAGLLAVEAYHAANIRTVLFARGLGQATNQISNVRDSVDGSSDLDQGVLDAMGNANIVPTDANALAFSRTAAQVLNVVYGTAQATTQGGFFPAGVNGTIRMSGANG